MKIKSIVTLLFVGLISVGCGGGDDGNSNTTVNNNLNGDETSTTTGVVVDSQVEGLKYISIAPNGESTSGVTNKKGEFEYFEDGSTTFYVSGIKIAEAKPQKMLSITLLAKNETEKTNIARFLQTLDIDKNPDNGITLPSSVRYGNEVESLSFDENFDSEFESVKDSLVDTLSDVSLVSADKALEHATKSERLSALQEMDLYKAIANEKYYNKPYYNADLLESDQRKRVYLWIWEKILAKEMAIENDLATQEFDVSKVEEQRDRYKKYLDYADSLVSLSSLGTGAYEQLTKAGSATMSYELVKLTSLTISGCDTVVKIENADATTQAKLPDNEICKNMMKVLNPVSDSADKLAVANPILSGFLPEALPIIMKYKKMNWLHFDTATVRALSKVHVSKPSLVSLGISLANIVNDSAGAYRASNINEELTTRLVAQEWLSIWFRSGFDAEYMNMLINDNSVSLKGNKEQIEAIALKLGSSGALCDAYQFFNPFVDCSGIENINYDYQKVADIINEKLTKSNAIYRNLGDLTGPIADEDGLIGVFDISWKADTNLTDVGESLKIKGNLIITNLNGEKESLGSDYKVRFAQCEATTDGGGGYFFSVNYPGVISSDGSFIIDLNAYDFDEKKAEGCLGKYGRYGFQFYRDINHNNTLDSEDIEIGFYATDSETDSNLSATHIVLDNVHVSINDYTMKEDEFIAIAPSELLNASRYYHTFKLNNGYFSADFYVDTYNIYTKYGVEYREKWENLSYFIFNSDKSTVSGSEAFNIYYDENFIAYSDDLNEIDNLKKVE